MTRVECGWRSDHSNRSGMTCWLCRAYHSRRALCPYLPPANGGLMVLAANIAVNRSSISCRPKT